jgi:photosystem II stability/assembly factor-like uncharacterized protein
MKRRDFLKTTLLTGLSLTHYPLLLSKIKGTKPVDFDIWEKTGGPIGGLGYNIRYRADSPNIHFVTDAWSGLQRSVDYGQTWNTINEGIDFRSGASNDAIPVFAFRIDPNNNNILWAGTENGGGLYRSIDGGDTWQKRDQGINLDPNPDTAPLTIRHIEIMPGDSNTIFVMGENHTSEWGSEFERVKGFIYKSTNGGSNFSLVKEFDSLTRWLFIDPRNTNKMVITTGIFDREADTDDPNSRYPSGPGLGVFKSVDGGVSWSSSNKGINTNLSLFVGGADVDPSNHETLIIATGNNADFAKGIFGAVYRSTNGGDSWNDVTPTYGSNKYMEPFTAVSFAPSNPNTVYVGSADAIYKSKDNGLTWTRYSGANGAPYGPEGVRSGVPIDMVVSHDAPNTLYVNNYGGGVFKSTNGAQSWQSWSKGYTGADIRNVAINPSNPLEVLCNGRSGVFLSDNKGDDWIGISNGIAAFPEGFGVAFDPSDKTGNTILTSDELDGHLLKSINKGLNWQKVLDLNTGEAGNRHGINKIRYAPSDPLVVYAGVMAAGFHSNPHNLDFGDSFGVYKSVNGGNTWSVFNNGLPTGKNALNVTDVAISPSNPNKVFITLRDGGIFKFDETLNEWVLILGNLPTNQSWGDIWENEDPIPRNACLSIAIHPKNDDMLLVGTHIFGMYKTIDGGINWAQVLSPEDMISKGTQNHGHITSIVFDPSTPSLCFASEWHGGMYMSTDAGENWTLINEGLSTRSIASIEISKGGEIVYAASQGEGVFRYQLKEITTSIDLDNNLPEGFFIHQNYPNPFNPSTKISYGIPKKGRVQIHVHNILGHRIETLLDTFQKAGQYSIEFDARHLASGTYLIKLESEGFVKTISTSLIK